MAPLVVYGAFGTGKTEALAQTALKLVSQPDNRTRVLICTHTNAYVHDSHYLGAQSEAPPLSPPCLDALLSINQSINQSILSVKYKKLSYRRETARQLPT